MANSYAISCVFSYYNQHVFTAIQPFSCSYPIISKQDLLSVASYPIISKQDLTGVDVCSYPIISKQGFYVDRSMVSRQDLLSVASYPLVSRQDLGVDVINHLIESKQGFYVSQAVSSRQDLLSVASYPLVSRQDLGIDVISHLIESKQGFYVSQAISSRQDLLSVASYPIISRQDLGVNIISHLIESKQGFYVSQAISSRQDLLSVASYPIISKQDLGVDVISHLIISHQGFYANHIIESKQDMWSIVQYPISVVMDMYGQVCSYTIISKQDLLNHELCSYPIYAVSRYLPQNVIYANSRTYILIDGLRHEIDADSLSLGQSVDSNLWECNFQVLERYTYSLLKPNTEFELQMNDFVFKLMVVNRRVGTLKREKNGALNPTLNINAKSPAYTLTQNQTQPISKTWNAARASQIATELAEDISLNWQTVDWMVAKGRLAIDEEYPLEIIKQIAKAPEAVVISRNDGGLRVRPRYKAAVPNWDSTTPDVFVSDRLDVIEREEFKPFKDEINQVRITDTEDGKSGEQFYQEQDINGLQGFIYCYTIPFNENINPRHTGNDTIRLEYIGVEEREMVEESIEIKDGGFSVKHPIFKLNDYQYHKDDLGELDFIVGTKDVSVKGLNRHGFGYTLLISVSYVTKFVKFKASSPIDDEVQVLFLKDE